MVLEYAMTILGAKKVFGLVSAGTSTLRKVGLFVCFDVPKRTLKFCVRAQKEIFFLPFRCASITYKALLNYIRQKQTVNEPTVSDGYESEGSTSTINSSESYTDTISNSVNTTSCSSSRSPHSGNLDALSVLANGNTDAKEVAKQAKAILTTSLESLLKLENWREQMKTRYLKLHDAMEEMESLPEDERFQALKVEKELFNGLYASWSYWKALKAKKEKLGMDFNKDARRFFTTVAPKAKKFEQNVSADISTQKSFISRLAENDDLNASMDIVEGSLRILCHLTSSGSAILNDFQSLKVLIKRVANENEDLRSRLDAMNKKLEEVFDSSANLRAEVSNLTNQFRNMISLEQKLTELKFQLEDARVLLLKAEYDRDDMHWKLSVLEKMIKEEEDFLDNTSINAIRSSKSPVLESNKKMN